MNIPRSPGRFNLQEARLGPKSGNEGNEDNEEDCELGA